MRFWNGPAHESFRHQAQRQQFGHRQICRIGKAIHGLIRLQVCGVLGHRNRAPHGTPNPPIIEQQFPHRPANCEDEEGRHGHKRDNVHGALDTRFGTPDVNCGGASRREKAKPVGGRQHGGFLDAVFIATGAKAVADVVFERGLAVVAADHRR